MDEAQRRRSIAGRDHLSTMVWCDAAYDTLRRPWAR